MAESSLLIILSIEPDFLWCIIFNGVMRAIKYNQIIQIHSPVLLNSHVNLKVSIILIDVVT